MKVTYLYHSGFAIEDEQALYVFDYYKGELPVIAKEKQMYVFVSHRHKDHYNSEIFDWEKEHPNILYILSDDVEAEPAPNRIFVKPEQYPSPFYGAGSPNKRMTAHCAKNPINIFSVNGVTVWLQAAIYTSLSVLNPVQGHLCKADNMFLSV